MVKQLTKISANGHLEVYYLHSEHIFNTSVYYEGKKKNNANFEKDEFSDTWLRTFFKIFLPKNNGSVALYFFVPQNTNFSSLLYI